MADDYGSYAPLSGTDDEAAYQSLSRMRSLLSPRKQQLLSALQMPRGWQGQGESTSLADAISGQSPLPRVNPAERDINGRPITPQQAAMQHEQWLASQPGVGQGSFGTETLGRAQDSGDSVSSQIQDWAKGALLGWERPGIGAASPSERTAAAQLLSSTHGNQLESALGARQLAAQEARAKQAGVSDRLDALLKLHELTGGNRYLMDQMLRGAAPDLRAALSGGTGQGMMAIRDGQQAPLSLADQQAEVDALHNEPTIRALGLGPGSTAEQFGGKLSETIDNLGDTDVDSAKRYLTARMRDKNYFTPLGQTGGSALSKLFRPWRGANQASEAEAILQHLHETSLPNLVSLRAAIAKHRAAKEKAFAEWSHSVGSVYGR